MELPEKLLNKTWSTKHGAFSSRDLDEMIKCISLGKDRKYAFASSWHGTDRRVDRATQLLRKAGLIEFAGGKWRVVVEREVKP